MERSIRTGVSRIRRMRRRRASAVARRPVVTRGRVTGIGKMLGSKLVSAAAANRARSPRMVLLVQVDAAVVPGVAIGVERAGGLD